MDDAAINTFLALLRTIFSFFSISQRYVCTSICLTKRTNEWPDFQEMTLSALTNHGVHNSYGMKAHNIMRNERTFFENVNETGAQEAGKREEMSAMCSLIKKCLTWKHLSQCHKSYFHISSQRRRQASKNFSLRISRTRFDGVNVDVNTFKVPLIFHVVSRVRRERKCDNLTARNCFQTFFFCPLFCHFIHIVQSLSLSVLMPLTHFTISISYQQNNNGKRWEGAKVFVTEAMFVCAQMLLTFPTLDEKKASEWTEQENEAVWKITCCASCYFLFPEKKEKLNGRSEQATKTYLLEMKWNEMLF